MRTTLNLDENTVDEIMRLTGKKNRSEAIRIALDEYIKLQQKNQVLAMRGQVSLGEDWQSLRQVSPSDSDDSK